MTRRRLLITLAWLLALGEIASAFVISVPVAAIVFATLFAAGALWSGRAGLGGPILVAVLCAIEVAGVPFYARHGLADWVTQIGYGALSLLGLVVALHVIATDRKPAIASSIVSAAVLAVLTAFALATLAGSAVASSTTLVTRTFVVSLVSQKSVGGNAGALMQASYATPSGRRVGSDEELCAVVAAQPLRLYCTITARIPGGRLIAAGVVTPTNLPYTLHVVGGTGAYTHARGTLRATTAGRRSEQFTFHLSR